MRDRRKGAPRIEDHGRLRRPGPAPDPAGTEAGDADAPPADDATRTEPTGRLQVKDGRHNVWETGVEDTQELLCVLDNPDLKLADEPPVEDGEPGNPYHSTGSWALRHPGPRRK